MKLGVNSVLSEPSLLAFAASPKISQHKYCVRLLSGTPLVVVITVKPVKPV